MIDFVLFFENQILSMRQNFVSLIQYFRHFFEVQFSLVFVLAPFRLWPMIKLLRLGYRFDAIIAVCVIANLEPISPYSFACCPSQ